MTALGSYRVFLNGSRIGRDVLTPDFTDYRKRVLYQAYDVTSLLVKGNNVIGALLGDGWYGSGLTWVGMHFFSPPDRFVAQLEIDYADGTHDTVISDDSWKAADRQFFAPTFMPEKSTMRVGTGRMGKARIRRFQVEVRP